MWRFTDRWPCLRWAKMCRLTDRRLYLRWAITWRFDDRGVELFILVRFRGGWARNSNGFLFLGFRFLSYVRWMFIYGFWVLRICVVIYRWRCRDKYSKHAKIANKTKTPMVKLSHKSSPCSVSVPKVVPNPNLNINIYVMFAIFAVGLICSHSAMCVFRLCFSWAITVFFLRFSQMNSVSSQFITVFGFDYVWSTCIVAFSYNDTFLPWFCSYFGLDSYDLTWVEFLWSFVVFNFEFSSITVRVKFVYCEHTR